MFSGILNKIRKTFERQVNPPRRFYSYVNGTYIGGHCITLRHRQLHHPFRVLTPIDGNMNLCIHQERNAFDQNCLLRLVNYDGFWYLFDVEGEAPTILCSNDDRSAFSSIVTTSWTRTEIKNGSYLQVDFSQRAELENGMNLARIIYGNDIYYAYAGDKLPTLLVNHHILGLEMDMLYPMIDQYWSRYLPDRQIEQLGPKEEEKLEEFITNTKKVSRFQRLLKAC